ncbi:MAG: carboxylating nicotinate-nucleotide diphosphorylase [Planctomycetaceae bacterium]|jgi:nicotinate-nucleotide pyrophosphorylase (carboxylating)|nr:carboxylating nicotinate-nucleotide diphosphorylase [Planctomycetaceae bacterium]
MPNEFYQHFWGQLIEEDLRRLIESALLEDTEHSGDITSLALVASNIGGSAAVVARQKGILAGMQVIAIVLQTVDTKLSLTPFVNNSHAVIPGTKIAEIKGPALSLLAAERLILNFISRLSGIATLTRQYVDAVSGTKARIFDTRKTTPGWRRLEKYAVVCGGGTNHRTGLSDAVLVKDNHLFLGQKSLPDFSAADAVRKAQDFTRQHFTQPVVIEVEVDTLEQLREVLSAEPDIVLLDNMSVEQLQEAVQIRNQFNTKVELEASGGINLHTVRSVAQTGVERISVGALTHSAVSLDFALDWQ